MTVTRSWTATVLNVDTDNDVMEISNFEESTSTNGHKTTKYADVAGTDGRTVLETPLRSLVFFKVDVLTRCLLVRFGSRKMFC